MELQDHYETFQRLDAEIISIAQLEKDPAMLPRISEFVHNSFPIVADPAQVTREPFDIFGIYLIDKEGVIQTYLPGEKEARPRLDILFSELAKLEGVTTPDIEPHRGNWATADNGVGESQIPDDVLLERWMWNLSQVRVGDPFKLALILDVAPGFHVYGSREQRMSPFQVELELPDGIELSQAIRYPKAETHQDPILDVPLSTYSGAIPMPVIYLRSSSDAMPGEYSIRANIRYQACNEATCLRPATKTIEFPVTVVGRKGRRASVAGSNAW